MTDNKVFKSNSADKLTAHPGPFGITGQCLPVTANPPPDVEHNTGLERQPHAINGESR